MEQMETVLGRLSEIEDAAVSLEEQAAEEKKRIAAEYEAKTKALPAFGEKGPIQGS